uniref:Protein HGH1 homolog n=1 Tax=Peronospora matthiolae TaxID=2874970 RepID=A0AAV1TCT0_9STRA
MTAPTTAEQVKSVEELVSFLSHSRPEVRKSASSLLVDLTASDQGIHQLLQLKKPDVVQALCRIVSDMRPIAEDAIRALINLTAANPVACERSLEFDLLNRVMAQVGDDEWRLIDYSMMLLANVSTTPEGAKALLGYDEKLTEAALVVRERKIRTLTNSFLDGQPEPDGIDSCGEPKWDDEYQYVANILANISQLEQGRDFLLKIRQSTSLAGALLLQLKSPNVVRRRGVTAALKNLCFDSDNHFYLYDQLDIPTHMMVLLAGPEELDEDDKMGMNPVVYSQGAKKKREHDRLVRLAAVDCLLLLCTTQNGRKVLRRKKVYPIIRNAHLEEPDDEIGDQIYKLVDFLIRDEDGEEPDWNEVRTKSFAADQETKLADDSETVLPPAPAAVDKAPEPKEPVARSKAERKQGTSEKRVVTASSTLPTSGEDEEVSEDIADQLTSEILALDVSSDEEDKDMDALGMD